MGFNPFKSIDRVLDKGSNALQSAASSVRNEFNDTTRTIRRTTSSAVNAARKINLSNVGHTVLDGAGFIPVVGGVADLANAGWYAAKGDKVNAALSAASAIPFAGDAFAAGKLGLKAAKGAEKLAETGTVAGRSVNVRGRNVAPAPSTLHTRGNRPDPAERTINGYVNRNVERAGGEITSFRPSGRKINRAGQSGTHNIGDAHFHEPYRDVLPDGTVSEGIRKKAVKAEKRHVKELYKALDEGRTRTKKVR